MSRKAFFKALTIDKRNQQLKSDNWDVNKTFETDAKAVGSNLVTSRLFFY